MKAVICLCVYVCIHTCYILYITCLCDQRPKGIPFHLLYKKSAPAGCLLVSLAWQWRLSGLQPAVPVRASPGKKGPDVGEGEEATDCGIKGGCT